VLGQGISKKQHTRLNSSLVTNPGEPRDLLAVRAREWFARVAAPRRRLADQPDLVRLDLLLFHGTAESR
jgi:hypothetical protein